MIQRPASKNYPKPNINKAKGFKGRVIGITPPYPERSQYKNCESCNGSGKNAGLNCPLCDGTGKGMVSKIHITYEIDRVGKDGPTTKVQEWPTDSLYAGGVSQDGKKLNPATWFKRLSVWYGTTDVELLKTADPWEDLGNHALPELVLLVDGFKVFDLRLYEGPGDRIHQVAVPVTVPSVDSKVPPVNENGQGPPRPPQPRIRPSAGFKTANYGEPGVEPTPTYVKTFPPVEPELFQEPEEDIDSIPF